MKNTKILEMINNGQIEELKALIQEEIFTDELKSKPGAKQRYAAMKKYFSYSGKNANRATSMPCKITFREEEYISFINGYSLALTKESSGEIELFGEPEKYMKVEKLLSFENEINTVDFNKVIAEARSKGYKLKRAEVEQNGDFRYIFHYDNAYFKIGLLDATFSIINDGSEVKVWHPGSRKEISPIIIENNLGVCMILPFNYNHIKGGVTVIEAA